MTVFGLFYYLFTLFFKQVTAMERIGEWSDRKITLAQMTCDAGLFDLLQCLSQWLKLSLLYLEMSFTAWESKERVIGEPALKHGKFFLK